MNEELEKARADSLYLCQKLINELVRTQSDIPSFMGGDVYKAYMSATEKAIDTAVKCRYKIRNL